MANFPDLARLAVDAGLSFMPWHVLRGSLRDYPPPRATNLGQWHFYLSNLLILGLSQLPISQRLIQPAWSLDIEMQFYIITPLIMAVLAARKSAAYMIVLLFGGVCLAVWLLLSYEGYRSVAAPMPLYAIFFLIGLAAAYYKWKPSAFTAHLSLLAGVVYIAVIIGFHKTRPLFLTGHFTTTLFHYQPAASFVLAILLAPYAMATVRVDVRTKAAWLAFADRHLSNLTYEVYLVHVSVLALLDPFTAGLSRFKQLPILLAGYALIFALAIFIYRFYDQPIDAMRRKFVKSAPRNPAASEFQRV